MIRIHRPDEAPAILKSRGRKERANRCRAYTRARKADPHATPQFEFRADIYGHRSVKSALEAAQHGKCCYCEAKVTHVAHGDVEHFRPKAGVRESTGGPLLQPGYYWLAYEWTNLFFACQKCNQSWKGNHFPLMNPAERAASHHDDLSRERPMLIDPASEDPEEHIRFREELAFPVGGDKRGAATIELLGPNDRPDLSEHRAERLQLCRGLLRVAGKPEVPEDLRNDARVLLKRATLDSAEYAAMVRAALAAR